MDGILDRVAIGLRRGTAYVVVFLDDEFIVRWVGPQAADMLGWSPGALDGRSGLDFVHPDDLPHVARLVAAELVEPHEYGVDPARRTFDEARFATADGGWKAFEFAANNLSGDPDVRGFVILMRDVTERRLLDDVYGQIVEGAPLDQTARRVAELLSWQCGGAAVVVELPSMEPILVGSIDVGATPVVFDLTDLGGQIVVSHSADREPSEWFAILGERAAGLLHLSVTRRLGELALRRRLDEKTALISAVSHDLRSPIAAIQLMSSLLDDNSDSLSGDQRRELIQRIGADARRTSRLLADLTSLDRLLHGSSDVVLQRVSMRGMIERVIGDLDVAERKVFLSVDEAGPAAFADPVLVERIVENLISNALKHTPVGSRVDVSVEAVDEHELVVHVDDDGAGVPTAARATMFDAYVRGADSSQRAGSGMGLFIVRTFAEVQAGRAMCGDSPLGGARFSVVLQRWAD